MEPSCNQTIYTCALSTASCQISSWESLTLKISTHWRYIFMSFFFNGTGGVFQPCVCWFPQTQKTNKRTTFKKKKKKGHGSAPLEGTVNSITRIRCHSKQNKTKKKQKTATREIFHRLALHFSTFLSLARGWQDAVPRLPRSVLILFVWLPVCVTRCIWHELVRFQVRTRAIGLRPSSGGMRECGRQTADRLVLELSSGVMKPKCHFIYLDCTL